MAYSEVMRYHPLLTDFIVSPRDMNDFATWEDLISETRLHLQNSNPCFTFSQVARPKTRNKRAFRDPKIPRPLRNYLKRKA
jgi:hypothetical protein